MPGGGRPPPTAQVLELVDKLDLGSSALVAWGFDFPPGHHLVKSLKALY